MPDTTLAHVPAMTAAVHVMERPAGALSREEFLSEYVAKSRPLVIRGAVAHWPARTKWRDKDYLKRRSGQHRVFAFPHEWMLAAARNEIGKTEMSFADAIDFLHAPDTAVGFVGTAMPMELLPDVGDFRFFAAPAETSFFYHDLRYLLYRNAGTTWHYHPLDETLMCQVIGRKRVGLLHVLSPRPHAIRDIFFREAYYDDPAAFAGFDNAGHVWFDATLDGGDALYIPPLWWHGVAPLDRDFGVTTPVTWRSPLSVIADNIRALASGQVALTGLMPPSGAQALLDVAQKLGLSEDLRRAAQQGIHHIQKETPPNLRSLWRELGPAKAGIV